MQTPYKPPHPNDRIYAHGSNPLPEFESLNIGSSRPGGPIEDAPMYVGMILTRKTVPGYSTPSWDEYEIPETQEELERKLSKWKSKSVDYQGPDMDGAHKRDEVDRLIKRENNKYPGYVYNLRLLMLKEGRNSQHKRICTKMTIILQRQHATKSKLNRQSKDPKQDLRDPYTGLPTRKPTQAPYGDNGVGYRNEDLKGDAGITGIRYRPQDQHNHSQNMPIHDPEHHIPPPPPPPAYPGLQFPASPHAHQGEDPRFQTPHHEGERFDRPAQNNPFPEPHFNNAEPHFNNAEPHFNNAEPHFNNAGPPMQNPHVSFEYQQNHGGLGQHPNTKGSHHISRPRSGAGHDPIIQEEYPRPGSRVGHHTNFQDEYNPRARSGAGHHPNMQGGNNNPRPISPAGDRFDGRDHHHAHPNGQTEQRFDVNEEFLNGPRGGGGPQFEEFQGNPPHLHPQSKKENRSGDTRGDVYGAGRNAEWKVHRDSGFFSGGSSDGGRSDYRNDQNFPKAHAEPRGKKTYPRDHQHGYQKDEYQSRNRSNDPDSDSNWKHRKLHTREQCNHRFRRRGSHQSLSSAHDQYESDYNGRTASHNKNRQNPRNGSRSMKEDYGDVRSNDYVTSGDDSDWYSEDASFHSSRGLGSPPTFRRSKRTPNVRIDDPRDRLDILHERGHERKRREAIKLREERLRHIDKLRLDREREETRNAREMKGRRSSGGRPRWTTYRQSDRYH